MGELSDGVILVICGTSGFCVMFLGFALASFGSALQEKWSQCDCEDENE